MINEDLYKRLQHLYGEVRVSKENDPGEEYTVPAHLDPITHEYIDERTEYDGGEEYVTCCPFCRDSGFHLYINYRYGTKDESGRSIALANCYHKCLEDIDNRRQLYFDIMMNPDGRRVGSKALKSLDRVMVPPEARRAAPVKKVIPLNSLPDSHPAWEYLMHGRSAGFSREELAPFNLGLGDDSDDWMTYDRIIIPVTHKGELVGWQARKYDESKRGPKYYTARGFTCGNYLYNFDNAVKCPYVILTEGAADVWRVGAPAVCLFGKSVSAGQERLIVSAWMGKPVCIMLDNDARPAAEAIQRKLARKHRGPVVIIPVPEGYSDPADVPAEVMRDYLSRKFGYE